MPQRILRTLLAALIAVIFINVLLHVFFARPSGDEGWYLYAAAGLGQGRWPFLNYFFTQGPLAPLLMAPAMAVSPTLLSGRIEAAFSFLLALLLGAKWLRRSNAAGGTLWWLLLAGASSFMVHMSTLAITTSYELLFVCLSLSLLAHERRSAAVAIAALSVTLRLSLAPWAFLVWLFASLSLPAEKKIKGSLCMAVLGAGLILLVFMPFAASAPEKFWEGLVGYHLSGGRLALSAARVWEFKRMFWADWPLLCLPALVAAGLAILSTWRQMKPDRWDALLLSGAVLLSVVHSLSATPYPKYQVAPAALLALLAARRLPLLKLSTPITLLLVILLLPWQIGHHLSRERELEIAWLDNPPSRHHAAGRKIAALAGDGPVLTFEPLLALEGGFALPPGYEMGPFSLTVSWDDARAQRLGTVTPNMVLADLEAARYLVLALHASDLGLADESARARAAAIISERYEQKAVFPRIGHFQESLFVFARKVSINNQP